MSRRHALALLRVLFLLACGWFAYRVLARDWDVLREQVRQLAPWLAPAGMLVAAGLLLTSWVWGRVLARYGTRVPTLAVAAVFFPGQVGKYLPGSVWSIGAQAVLARRWGAGVAPVVGTGLVFLALNVASAAALGGAGVLSVAPTGHPWERAAGAASLVLGVAALTPTLVRAGSWVAAGRRARAAWRWGDAVASSGTLVVVWTAYATASWVLFEPGDRPDWGLVLVATTVSYAVGVLVVVAPAGLGAREAVFVALLTSQVTAQEATAVALAARLVHTVCDFGLAGVGWWLLRAESDGGGVPAGH